MNGRLRLRFVQELEQRVFPHGVELLRVDVTDGERAALLAARAGLLAAEALHNVLALVLLVEEPEGRQPVRVVAIHSAFLDRADELQDVGMRV